MTASHSLWERCAYRFRAKVDSKTASELKNLTLVAFGWNFGETQLIGNCQHSSPGNYYSKVAITVADWEAAEEPLGVAVMVSL